MRSFRFCVAVRFVASGECEHWKALNKKKMLLFDENKRSDASCVVQHCSTAAVQRSPDIETKQLTLVEWERDGNREFDRSKWNHFEENVHFEWQSMTQVSKLMREWTEPRFFFKWNSIQIQINDKRSYDKSQEPWKEMERSTNTSNQKSHRTKRYFIYQQAIIMNHWNEVGKKRIISNQNINLNRWLRLRRFKYKTTLAIPFVFGVCLFSRSIFDEPKMYTEIREERIIRNWVNHRNEKWNPRRGHTEMRWKQIPLFSFLRSSTKEKNVIAGMLFTL